MHPREVGQTYTWRLTNGHPGCLDIQLHDLIAVAITGVGDRDSRRESVAVPDRGARECQVRVLEGCVRQTEAKWNHWFAGVVSICLREKEAMMMVAATT